MQTVVQADRQGNRLRIAENFDALFGLVEALKQQNKTSSAKMVQKEFDKAWQTADVKLSVAELSGLNLTR